MTGTQRCKSSRVSCCKTRMLYLEAVQVQRRIHCLGHGAGFVCLAVGTCGPHMPQQGKGSFSGREGGGHRRNAYQLEQGKDSCSTAAVAAVTPAFACSAAATDGLTRRRPSEPMFTDVKTGRTAGICREPMVTCMCRSLHSPKCARHANADAVSRRARHNILRTMSS